MIRDKITKVWGNIILGVNTNPIRRKHFCVHMCIYGHLEGKLYFQNSYSPWVDITEITGKTESMCLLWWLPEVFPRAQLECSLYSLFIPPLLPGAHKSSSQTKKKISQQLKSTVTMWLGLWTEVSDLPRRPTFYLGWYETWRCFLKMAAFCHS